LSEAVVATPPGFGAGKPWQIRTLVCYERDDTENIDIITNGMPVHEKLRAVYWSVSTRAARAIEAYRAAGIAPPFHFSLTHGGKVVATGTFNADDSADDMAWIACFFAERGLSLAIGVSGKAVAP
jgi:hypothetical protein